INIWGILELHIKLPSRFTRDTMYSFLERVITPDGTPISNKIIFDCSTLTYIEPVAITILSNTIEWLNNRSVITGIHHPSIIVGSKFCPITYLDDSMFFKRYEGETITRFARVRPTTLPLELISYNSSSFWIIDKFIPWLARQVGVNTHSLSQFEVCVGEIFNNINDHSSEHIGCIYAQHYPNLKQIKIAISDFGVGIPFSIQQKYPFLNDAQALTEAIKEGVSIQSSPGNRGAGLTNIITAVSANGGSVHIHSNAGIIECISGETGTHIASKHANGYYPGTLFEIILNTNNIFDDEEEEEFEW
ncbi:hypothetical protein OE311_26375, partial [Bacillus cereus]|nr:hypothetical protein [Bacillus cereus]